MLRWQVGDVRITQVVELSTASLGPYLLPQATPEALGSLPWLKPFVDDDGRIVLSMHSLIIESQGQLLMVDTCVGNDKQRSYPRWNLMQGDYLARLSVAGFEPEQFDTVLCTHMHVDHVGWNTRLVDGTWQPTFGNARYLYAEEEWAHWKVEPQEYGPVIEDSVQPIFDAGLADLVLADHGINVPTFNNGSFATVMCHTAHMGAPSVAVDSDATVAADNNWVWSQAQQMWIKSPDYFGIAGDFILRTVIQQG